MAVNAHDREIAMSGNEKKKAVIYLIIATAMLVGYFVLWGTSGKLFSYFISMYVFAVLAIFLHLLGFLKQD